MSDTPKEKEEFLMIASKYLEAADSAKRLSDVFERDARRFSSSYTEEEEARA